MSEVNIMKLADILTGITFVEGILVCAVIVLIYGQHKTENRISKLEKEKE